MDKYEIPYLNMIVRKFSERFGLSLAKGFAYLKEYGGLNFLVKFYDIEHTLPIDDTLDELVTICQTKGGALK